MSNKPEYSIFDPAKIPCEEIIDSNALVKEPLVSVKMITYNHAPYIAHAIEGVLMQETDFPIELVIGEDCSTDGTREIVFDYQKRHPDIIRVITSDKNVGAFKNSLRTEKACRGKYIAFCEGDDFWHHPKKLQIQVEYLESHPDVGLVHSDLHRLHQETGRVEKNVNQLHDLDFQHESNPFEGILQRTYEISTCTVCARKALIYEAIKNEYELISDPNTKQGDLPRWLYITHKAKVHYFNESLATYRVLNESTSHSNSTIKELLFKQSGNKVRNYFAEKYRCKPHIRNNIQKNYYSLLLDFAYHKNEREIAKDAYQQLLQCGHKLTTLQRAYFLCSEYRAIKIAFVPLVHLRRIWLQWRKKKHLSKIDSFFI